MWLTITGVMSWKNMMKDLMETNIFSDQTLQLLKIDNDNYTLYNPNTVMNLRHERVKRNRQKLQSELNYKDILQEARRMVSAEEHEELSRQQDLKTVAREINRFKRHLEQERKKIQKQTEGLSHKCVSFGNNFQNFRTPPKTVPSITEFFSDDLSSPKLATSDQPTNNDSIPEMMNHFKTPPHITGGINVVDKTLSSVSSNLQNTFGLTAENENNACKIRERTQNYLARKALNVWKTFVQKKKSLRLEDENQFIQNVVIRQGNCSETEFDAKHDKTKRIIHSTLTQWRNFVSQKKLKRIKTRKVHFQFARNNSHLPDVEHCTVRDDATILNLAWQRWKVYVEERKFYRFQSQSRHIVRYNFPISADVTPGIMSIGSLVNVTEREKILTQAWKNWKHFVSQQKLKKAEKQKLSFQEDMITSYYNHKLLRKFWIIWKTQRNQKKIISNQRKENREQKIDVFLRNLQHQKLIINSKSKGIHKKNKTENEFADKKTDFIGRRRLPISRSRRTGPEVRHRNRDEGKLPLVVQNKNTPIHYRFEAQKHIIAKQKEKLQEQGKIIEELKLQRLERDAEESAKEAKEKINETLANITLRTKDRTVNLQSLIPPIRLVRMTERAKERERRWQLLKEKKQKAEEERLKQIEEEEQRKKQEEEDEKRRKIEELKEKRQREKEMELYKQQEKERIRQLTKKANDYYKRKLLKKFGITPLKRLITLREEQLIVVAAYHRRRLLLRHFYVWKIHVQDILKEKNDKAETYYKMQLLRRSLLALLLVADNWEEFKVFLSIIQEERVPIKQLHCCYSYLNPRIQLREEYICKEQVADDFYESQLQKRVFIHWQTYTCSQHLQLVIQLERAAAFYNRKIVMNSLEQWRRLPTIQKYEREKEERKRLWRQRVREMLPDFQPVQILEESY